MTNFYMAFFITFWISTGFVYVGRHDEYCRLYEIKISLKRLTQNVLILLSGPLNWFTYEKTFPKWYTIPKNEDQPRINEEK
jgi:hypothetical protein